MSKALFNLPVLTAALFSIAATIVLTAVVFADKPDPPTLMLDQPMPAPDFKVTDHNGETLTKDDLLGRVWVCDFFLTRCNGVCPILGKKMATLIDEIAKDKSLDAVRFVSFSVDPEHDTVERLRAYRKTNRSVWVRGDEDLGELIDQRWAHARADDRDAFWRVVSQGFGLFVGEAPNDPSTPVGHSSRLVLIDQRGDIRGYYEGMTDEDTPALLADIRRLVEGSD
ncbi:MAG: SCO family protein [Phycisphaeraceae bacterium]